MKNGIFALLVSMLFSPAVLAAEAPKSDEAQSSPMPFSTEENVHFLSRDFDQVSLFGGKHQIGIFVRGDTKSDDLNYVDFYSFPETKKIEVDADVCREGVKRVLGSLDGWKLAKPVYDKGRYGKICDTKVTSDDAGAEIKERRILVAFIHGKPHIFVAKFLKATKPADVEELHDFVKGLHEGADSSMSKKTSARMPASEPVKK